MSGGGRDGEGSGDSGGASAPGADWRPTALRAALVRRAEIAAAVRAFFAARGVLEVETPLIGAATTPELHLESLAVDLGGGAVGWLQTSPEFHMKRLLAAGSGPIFQLARVVRGGEAGRRHNREFTLLEWYRPGWDHHRLIGEVEALLEAVLGEGIGSAERLTYGEAFRRHAGVDPHRAPLAELDAAIARAGVAAPAFGPDDRDGRLHLLMALVVEPRLGPGVVALHDFPASQASLARVRPAAGGAPPLAERFEVYVGGVELANGFHELTDPAEQRRRFESDLACRRATGLPPVPLDHRLLAALGSGLPASAGVALGFDRLVMLATGAGSIDEVLAFPAERA
ncbi:MAG TPA: EF-P lysine aminoacylase EpmA [Thermoanaerobaculia bacterium]|nr:EF-P lysine aminoacylase EpmA [Thermoanaerobaculia bacterium]